MVGSCKHLGVRPFVLEVRSWSGNEVPVNLHQTNDLLCPDKDGQGPKAQPSASKVQVSAKRRQSSVGSWGPSPQTLFSYHRWGSRAPRTQLVLRLPRPATQQGQGPTDCDPDRQPLPLGRGWLPPQGLVLARGRHSPPPVPRVPQLTHWTEARDSPLTYSPHDNHHFSWPLDERSVMVTHWQSSGGGPLVVSVTVA